MLITLLLCTETERKREVSKNEKKVLKMIKKSNYKKRGGVGLLTKDEKDICMCAQ